MSKTFFRGGTIELERVETCIQRMNVNNLLFYWGEEHSIGKNVKWRKTMPTEAKSKLQRNRDFKGKKIVR
jgi:hypothetical protein